MSAERPTSSIPFEWVGRNQPRNTGYWLAGTPAMIPGHAYGGYLNDEFGGLDPEEIQKWLGLLQPGGAWPNVPTPAAEPPTNALASRGQSFAPFINALTSRR